MPVQTSKVANIYFPDGCKVEVKKSGGSYTDLGAIKGTAKAALQWKENQVQTANAGKTALQIKDMVIEGGFTLLNIDPDGVEAMGGGMFTKDTNAGTPVTTIPDQVIPAGWADNIKYELIALTSPTDDTKLRLDTKPVLTSVKLNYSAPETLTEIGAGAGGDYMVVADAESSSGWSIVFNSAGMATDSPKTYSITVDWGTNTPVGKTTISVGTSTKVLTAYSIKFTHTDSAGLTRGVEIFSANPKSGGFNFDFKGADEEGCEELPLSFTGQIDTSLTDGYQLMSMWTDTGAE